MQIHGSESLRLLRREAPRKRSAGGRDGVRVVVVCSADLRIDTWNCGGLCNVTESLFGDIPDLDFEKGIEIAPDREEWKKFRSS